MFKKVKLEKFKCLLCGEFFFKTKEELLLAQEEAKDVSKHPDELKHKILCPKCQSHTVQYIETDNKKIEDKLSFLKANYNSVSSFLGDFLGSVLALFIILWEENQFVLIKSVFSFIAYLLAVLACIKLFHVEPLYCCLIILAYKFLDKK